MASRAFAFEAFFIVFINNSIESKKQTKIRDFSLPFPNFVAEF